MENKSAIEIIEELQLQPHPEGGHYRELFRDTPATGERGAVTAIYFLLEAGVISAWHRVDAVEMWHHYAGAPLRLRISNDGKICGNYVLGNNLDAGESPFQVVPKDAWQSAESLGDWTLVGCTVAPAFEFSGFEMAEPGWEPGE